MDSLGFGPASHNSPNRDTLARSAEEGLLRLEKVRKVYPDIPKPKVVLDDIDLSVKRGEFVALVGPSGGGKTTLLRLILGEDEPTSGKLTLDGEPLGFPDTRRGIVPQHYGLFPHLTVLQNIMLGDRLSRAPFGLRKDAEQAEAFLAEANLTQERDKYPNQLSGGQKQRAAVMQALIKDPKLLLMDEPFGALDPGTRERMQVFILRLWERRRKTILFVTHDLEEAVFLAPRIIALSSFERQKNDISKGEQKEHLAHGSRIVYDKVVRDSQPLSTEAKKDPRFTAIIEEIRDIAFEPDEQVHEFDKHHAHKFDTAS